MFQNLDRFEASLPATAPAAIEDLSTDLRIYSDPKVDIWFTPMPTRQQNPKLWILGITPGWQQMRIAYAEAAKGMQSGLSPTEAVAMAKPNVAFAGSMRTNLVAMLDDLELHSYLGVDSSADLFGTEQLKAGSVLRCPIFNKGSNYNGHSPKPLSHPALRQMLDELFAPELQTTGDCLILPLGRAVEEMLAYTIEKTSISPERVLSGFPHPSGANGHRKRHYAERKSELKKQIKKWIRTAS